MVAGKTFQPFCTQTKAPPELSIITASLATLFTVVNIPGNVLIILAVVLDPNKNLRSPFNWLLVNLATADLLTGIILQPIVVHLHIQEFLGEKLVVEEVIIVHMTFFISCTASVLSISSLAVERYLAVRRPNTYQSRVTNKRVVFTIAGIWLLSLSLPNIYFRIGFSAYGFIFVNTSTGVAVIVMCLTYILIIRKVRERSISTRNNRSLSTRPEILPSHDQNVSIHQSNTISRNAVEKSREKLEAKVTKMFLVVLIALLCCYGPSTSLVYLTTFCEVCSCTMLHWCRDFHANFVVLNSSVNFFCYALQSPRFRKAFVKLLKMEKQRETRNISNNNISVQNISGRRKSKPENIAAVQGVVNIVKQYDTAL